MNQAIPELNPSPRILLGPGPSSVHPRVLRAMSTPLLGYLDPEFVVMLGETQDLLRQVFQTRNTLTLPVSGTGMAGMESVLSNLLEPGDKMLVCAAGFFGNRLEEVALRLGAIYAGLEPHEEVEDVLKVYSEALGIAYQIRDDLSDLGAGGETNDLAGLRPSLLLAIAHEKAKDARKELLASVWHRQLPAGVTTAAVESLYAELGADTRARTLLETFKEEAIRCLRDLENPNLKGLLRRVLGKIFNDVEIKGWCKEQEMKNGVRDGARAEIPAEAEIVAAG